MSYFISYFEGEAIASIKELKLCHDNYKVAKDLSKDGLGDKQTLISCHRNKLLSLSNTSDFTDIKSLRNLFEIIETQVCNLNCLGYDCHYYVGLE